MLPLISGPGPSYHVRKHSFQQTQLRDKVAVPGSADTGLLSWGPGTQFRPPWESKSSLSKPAWRKERLSGITGKTVRLRRQWEPCVGLGLTRMTSVDKPVWRNRVRARRLVRDFWQHLRDRTWQAGTCTKYDDIPEVRIVCFGKRS